MKREEQIINLIQKQINDIGYILYDCEIKKEAGQVILTVTIDQKTDDMEITIDDCQKVNDVIDPIIFNSQIKLDDIDSFEVSSPGIEKRLRKDSHFKNAIGKEIEVKLYKKINGTNVVVGILTKYEDNKLHLKCGEDEIQILKKEISSAKTTYDFSNNLGGNDESNR